MAYKSKHIKLQITPLKKLPPAYTHPLKAPVNEMALQCLLDASGDGFPLTSSGLPFYRVGATGKNTGFRTMSNRPPSTGGLLANVYICNAIQRDTRQRMPLNPVIFQLSSVSCTIKS